MTPSEPTIDIPHGSRQTTHNVRSFHPNVEDIAQRRWQAVALIVVMLVFGSLGLWQLSTPSPAPSDAAPSTFSATRAMSHLEIIASSSRAIGMPGHESTRDYLLEQLTMMGLQPEVQTASALLRFEGADSFNAGTVTNVLARLPGTSSTGAIVINAHYDGGSTGPAAGDNGAAVAASLELLRALQAGPPLENDLIIVFSDGEENGDLGASAFNQDHPWANDARLAVNFEAQGSGGPVILYATSDQNGWLTSEFFDVAPEPSAYSLLPEVVRQLPGMRLACDLEDYLLKGSAGLGFVFASDTPAYHSERDSVANINRGSIQQAGENTLAVVRHFGSVNLTNLPETTDRVFFNVLPGVVLHYRGGLVIPWAALITLLSTWVLVLGVRRKLLTPGGMAIGIVVLLLGSLLTTVIVALIWIIIRTLNSDYQVLLIGNYQSDLYVVALSLAAIAVMTGIYWVMRRWLRTDDLYAGAVIGWIVLMWLVSVALPGASYLMIWPVLFALLPLAWSTVHPRQDRASWPYLGVLALALAPAFFLTPGTYYQIVALLNRLDYFSGLSGGIAMFGLWALFIAPQVGLYLRQIEMIDNLAGSARFRATPIVCAVAAATLIVVGNLTSGFDAEHPRPNHIAYELDGNTGSARWVSVDNEPDEWTSRFLSDSPEAAEYELVQGTFVDAWAIAAPAVQVPLPTVEITSDAVLEDVRSVTFIIASPRGAAGLEATVRASGRLVGASIDGRPVDLVGYGPANEGELRFSYAGVPESGIEVSLTVQSDDPITVELLEMDYGLPSVPGLTVQPRPDNTMPASGLPLDATIVRLTITI